MNVGQLLSDASAVDWMALLCVIVVNVLVNSFRNGVLRLLKLPMLKCSFDALSYSAFA